MVSSNKTSAFGVLVSLFFLLPGGNSFQPLFSSIQKAQTLGTTAPFEREHSAAIITAGRSSLQTSIRLFYEDNDEAAYERQREFERVANTFLRASHDSFQNVEKMTDSLLNRQPLVALAIFVGTGAMVAYMLGFFFLGGYIETWNPVENDSIPYWDDEILVITRKIGR